MSRWTPTPDDVALEEAIQRQAQAEALRQRIRDAILLLRDRHGQYTFAPSMIAQQVAERKRLWRDLMPTVREEILYMSRQGLIGLYIRQEYYVIADGLRGIYRIGLPNGESLPYIEKRRLEEAARLKRTKTYRTPEYATPNEQ